MKKLLKKLSWNSRFSPLLFIFFFSLSFFGTTSVFAQSIPFDDGTNLVFDSSWTPDAPCPPFSCAKQDAFVVSAVLDQAIPYSGSPFDFAQDPPAGVITTVGSSSFTPNFSIAWADMSLTSGDQYELYTAFNSGPSTYDFTDVYCIEYHTGGTSVINHSYCSELEPPEPTDQSTRIITLSPAQGEVASSSPDISGTYFNNTPVYNQLLIDLSWVEPSVNADLLLSGLAHRQYIFDIGTSTSNQDFSTSTDDLLTGRWLLSAKFSNGTDAFNYFTATTTTFIVGTTTTFFSDFVDYATTTPPLEPIEACAAADTILEKAICALGDRIKAVFQFLLVPDATVLGRFADLKTDIMSRVPFGYFPLVKSALDGASASSTPIFSMIIPVALIPNFNLVRGGLAWVMLFWWIIHMFRRFKHVQL